MLFYFKPLEEAQVKRIKLSDIRDGGYLQKCDNAAINWGTSQSKMNITCKYLTK